ncbi:TetR/AcrR family transcriptional regulator [Rubrobacter xylanophilus]|uniref:TetR/AcrR family transcriptional regulator n=1 Tax=Rubrobacter xylanophilus TaxID=49319 RepID=UPI00003A1EE7|nr:TetR family transcriptional regulator C-terminal domain-containing protein [Rubrobacter xylanophilus]
MPRVVDHEERRRELAEAAWRVILREGVEGVSVRNVAAEAGWSVGALRHYFGTKEELLAGAARLVVERVTGRFERGRYEGPPREAVRRMLCEVLPLDDERRVEARVWLAFAAHSLVDPRVAEEHELVFDGMRELCRLIVRRLSEDGLLVSGAGDEEEAARLHALVDGLALHGLLGRLGSEEMLAALDAHLAAIIAEPGEGGAGRGQEPRVNRGRAPGGPS